MPDHVETILYEIDMLDHCFARLGEPWQARGKDYNLCLEGFLLHYKNLIEFFGDREELRAGKPEQWSPKALSPAEVASIQNVDLHKTYHESISRCLNHCNRIRAEAGISWKRVEMYEEIKPLLENFRKLFPSVPRPVAILGPEDASTVSSVSILSPSILLDCERTALGLRKPDEIADKASEQEDDSDAE
jgi:hypothetical protein